MNLAATFLVILNFLLIGLLPIVFFRRDGSFNLAWLSTAAPFFVTAVVLILGLTGFLQAVFEAELLLATAMQLLAVLASVVSIMLIGLTIGVHRVPLALWHQQNDAPVELVTWGPYARIRHPFYTSFLLAFSAAILVFPHYLTLLVWVYSSAVLTLTAKREEQRLMASAYGDQYSNYCRHTGRFLPRLTVMSND
jgi:protein-S-isoprenylcysteine O-methyltransferase Ste14